MRQGLAVIRFEKSVVTPAGVDVVVGEGVDASELRTVIAADPASFGLTLEEFASLTWLDHLPPARYAQAERDLDPEELAVARRAVCCTARRLSRAERAERRRARR